ncbi:MAG: antibiotic biosynthesis monooxygenase family protein [Chitinophagales bacterium]|nr:antibiotic biosynthesis monooxygenase family protein [Chitinophagales bacterium]
MIVRIVKLTFQPDRVDDFLGIFNEMKELISSSPGCLSLTLLRDKGRNNIFFTYSTWEDEASLEAYRQSETFSDVWSKAKVAFSDKPEAWTLQEQD